MQAPLFSQTHKFTEPPGLNDFSTSIGSKTDTKIKHSSEPVFSKSCKKSIFLFPTTTTEICHIWSKFTNSNSEGKYGIPNKFVKWVSPIILETSVVLINRCMVEGYFPKSLKLSEVVAFFKPRDKHEPSYYCQISVRPSLSKIVERVMYIRFESFLGRT